MAARRFPASRLLEPVTLGGVVRAFRERLLLTQEQLAERAGLSVGTVQGLESGRIRRPRSLSVRLLADALALSDEDRASLTALGRNGPARPATVAPPSRTAPAQLNAPVSGFVGRTDHLRVLDTWLAHGRDHPSPGATIVAISGTAGVGKTALAVQWLHRVADRFPDGQLYLDLRGYATVPPVRPIEALGALLRSLGDTNEQVPLDLAEASARFRSFVAGRRVLLFLDNARSVRQIGPLLPGSPHSLVVVTSRDSLTGLVVRHGARRLALDVMPLDEAMELLTRVLGDRAGTEPDAVAALAEVCARLPLALRVAAANLLDNPHRTVAEQVTELAGGNGLRRLAVEGDRDNAVQLAIDLSYRAIGSGTRRMFRLLGLAPGIDFTPAAAAELAGLPQREAARLLDRLAAHHLVRHASANRYAFHDLLRAYALDRSVRDESDAARTAAVDRLCRWYLRTAAAAVDLLYPDVHVRLPLEPAAGVSQATFEDRSAARGWLDAEWGNLVAVACHAAAHGPRSVGWLLADTLRGYLWARRHTTDWRTVASAALAAARKEGDLRAQAAGELSLADLDLTVGRYREAEAGYIAALALAEQADWAKGRAAVFSNLGIVYWSRGELPRAAELYTQALAVYRQGNLPGGEASALTNLGIVYRALGRLQQAAEHHEQALALFRRLGSDREAAALANLGVVEHDEGRLVQAMEHLSAALTRYRRAGDRPGETQSRYAVAAVHRDAGRYELAQEQAQVALALARETGDGRDQLEALNVAGSVQVAVGRADRAVAHHQEALALAGRTDARMGATVALLGLAAAWHQLGDPEKALDLGNCALEGARAGGYRVVQGQALTLLAEVHYRRGRRRQAVEYANRALDSHRATGHRPGEARARAVLDEAVREPAD